MGGEADLAIMRSTGDPGGAIRITRRALLALAALPAAGAGRPPAAPAQARVERLRLSSASPWSELARAWRQRRLGLPRRVAARPAPFWWPHERELPESWEAWIEFDGGRTLLVECRPRGAPEQERPEMLSLVTRRVAAALRA